jgi:hypothetical protein
MSRLLHVMLMGLCFTHVLQPERPDELARIESVGGQVIYWQGPRVLGVLAMSRSIGTMMPTFVLYIVHVDGDDTYHVYISS